MKLDKWNKELEALSKRRYKNMDSEIYNFYKDTLKELKVEIKDYLESYEELSFSKRLELESQFKRAGRIDEILGGLSGRTTQSVTDYVRDELQLGYNGVWYAIEGAENVQLDFGMLPERYINELVNKSVDGKKFSTRLYQYRSQLAERTTTALLSGAASGDGYRKVAKQIGELTEANYKQALRIARTEGGRVQSTAKQKAYEEAEQMGVDLQKQWMSTLDKKTRYSHQVLDGQLVDVDDYFVSEQGNKAQGPRLFGDAGEDINCRCTTITVVNGISPKTRKDNESKEIIKYTNYNEWAEAKGYQKSPEPKDWREKIKQRLKENGSYSLGEVQEIGKLASPEFRNEKVDQLTSSYHQAKNEYDEYFEGYETAKTLPREEYAEWYKGYKERLDQRDSLFEDLYEERTAFVAQKLAEVREVGKPIKEFTKYSSVEHKKTLTEVSKLLPKEWMELSDEEPVYVMKTKRGYYRAHSKGMRDDTDKRRKVAETLGFEHKLSKKDYEYYYDTIAISGTGTSAKATAIHELGHRMEHLKPEIKKLEHEFYRKRTKGEELVHMGKGYRKTEVTRVDDFINPYIGKDYGNKEDSYYELLSLGLESLYTGAYNIDNDEDYKSFVLGILLTQ